MGKIEQLLLTMMTSAVPILEQKVAIPMGIINFGFSYAVTYIVTLIGAMIPAPLILKFMPYILKFLKKIKGISKIVEWYEKRAMKKGGNIVKYELIGLFLFVAIPLPGTGVWTGSTVAALLKLDFRKSLGVVFLGAIVCGLILLAVTVGATNIIPWL